MRTVESGFAPFPTSHSPRLFRDLQRKEDLAATNSGTTVMCVTVSGHSSGHLLTQHRGQHSGQDATWKSAVRIFTAGFAPFPALKATPTPCFSCFSFLINTPSEAWLPAAATPSYHGTDHCLQKELALPMAWFAPFPAIGDENAVATHCVYPLKCSMIGLLLVLFLGVKPQDTAFTWSLCTSETQFYPNASSALHVNLHTAASAQHKHGSGLYKGNAPFKTHSYSCLELRVIRHTNGAACAHSRNTTSRAFRNHHEQSRDACPETRFPPFLISGNPRFFTRCPFDVPVLMTCAWFMPLHKLAQSLAFATHRNSDGGRQGDAMQAAEAGFAPFPDFGCIYRHQELLPTAGLTTDTPDITTMTDYSMYDLETGFAPFPVSRSLCVKPQARSLFTFLAQHKDQSPQTDVTWRNATQNFKVGFAPFPALNDVPSKCIRIFSLSLEETYGAWLSASATQYLDMRCGRLVRMTTLAQQGTSHCLQQQLARPMTGFAPFPATGDETASSALHVNLYTAASAQHKHGSSLYKGKVPFRTHSYSSTDSPPQHTHPPPSQDSDKTQTFPPQMDVTSSSSRAHET